MPVPSGLHTELVPHDVFEATFLHAPLPSQVPVWPQGGLEPQRESAALAARLWQEPSKPATPHERQVPHDDDMQQYPSMQLLVVQSPLMEQERPVGLVARHAPELQ